MTTSEALQWAEMEEAMLLAKLDGEQEADSDDDEAMTDWLLGPGDPTAVPRDAARAVCRMADGDLHLCRSGCKFVVENDDGCMVCEISGIDYGPKATRSDHCTGRSTWSADPDANACMGGTASALGGGGWRKRPDQFQASASAYMMARTFDDSEMPPAVAAPRAATCKRGARCVDESHAEPLVPKRARSQKRDSSTIDGMRTLHHDASKLFERLLATRATQRRASASDAVALGPAEAVDPRLLDQRKLFEAAVRKYVRDVTAKGVPPSMDALHNLAMAVNDVVKQEHAKQQQMQKQQLALVDTRAFRTTVCELIVALWHASSTTPYFENSKRGADSFRSFASGVLYALKRGVTTPNGTLLVPPVPEFAAALPTARAISAGDPSLKSLHAASHKGLCSLHRVIASVGAEQADAVFAEPVRVAQRLAALAAR